MLFIIYNFLNDLSKKCLVTTLVRSMTFIGGLNLFSAIYNIANITLYSTFIEEENEN